MVILNTCHIREKASEKFILNLVGAPAQRAGARPTGPADDNRSGWLRGASRGAEITRRAPWVDIVGPQTYHRLPELVSQIDPMARNRVIDTDFPEEVSLTFCRASMPRVGQQHFERAGRMRQILCILCCALYTRC